LIEIPTLRHQRVRASEGLKVAGHQRRDPFANVRSSRDFAVPAWVGAMIRGNDKISRIKSFIKKRRLENEALEDSLRDLAVYTIIALVLYEEEREGAPSGQALLEPRPSEAASKLYRDMAGGHRT